MKAIHNSEQNYWDLIHPTHRKKWWSKVSVFVSDVDFSRNPYTINLIHRHKQIRKKSKNKPYTPLNWKSWSHFGKKMGFKFKSVYYFYKVSSNCVKCHFIMVQISLYGHFFLLTNLGMSYISKHTCFKFQMFN